MAIVTLNKQGEVKPVTTFKDMEKGDIAVIIDASYKGNYVIKVYERIASLSDSSTWGMDAALTVRILSKGESITLTQE